MLKLTILGCGTSSGVPRIGGDWGECDPAEPRNRRTRASILVESPTTRILVDTGPDLREQMLAAGIGSVDAVLWTHDHADHCHGIDDLRQIAQNTRSPIRGLARQQVIDLLSARFNYAFVGRTGYPPIIAAEALPETGSITIGDICVDTVDQPHGDIFSSGFRFVWHDQSIGYSTDFHDVTPDMRALFTGVDIWVADALRDRPHPTHAHIAMTLEAARAIQPGRTILTHMDNSMDYAALSKRLPQGVEPGYDGMVVLAVKGG